MPPQTSTRPSAARGTGDVRRFHDLWNSTDHRWVAVAAAVGGCSVAEPALTLRWGAVACGIFLLLHLRRLRPAAPDLAAVALTLYATASLSWTVDATGTVLAVKNQWSTLVIFVAIRAMITDTAKLRLVVGGYVAGTVYGVALIIVQNFHSLTLSSTIGARYGIDGLNYNYLGYGLALGAGMIVVLHRLLADHPAARFPLLPLLALPALGVVWCGSRAAFCGLVLAAIWLLGWRIARRTGVAVLATVTLVTALAVASGYVDSTLNTALDSMAGRATGDLAGRITTWPIAREAFAEHFWFGLGSGAFRSVNPFDLGAHNVVLELGSGLGVIGLALFVTTLGAAVVYGTRGADPAVRTPLVGAFLLICGPIYMSGHWELSPAAWAALAICSRLGLAQPPPPAQPAPAGPLIRPAG